MLNYILVLLMGFSLIGCATKVLISDQSFVTPGVSGKLRKGSVGVSLRSNTAVVLADSNLTAATDIQKPRIEKGDFTQIQISSFQPEFYFGLAENVELMYNNGYGVKVGSSPAQKQLPWAVAAGTGATHTQSSSSGSGTFTYDVKNKSTATWIGASVGMLQPVGTIYLSFTKQSVLSKTDLDLAGVKTSYSDTADSSALSAGLEKVINSSKFACELTANQVAYPRATTTTNLTAGLRWLLLF